MRYAWIIFAGLLVAMAALLPRLEQPRAAHSAPTPAPSAFARYARAAPRHADPGTARADSIVAFGLAQRGTPYVWAGTSPRTGFDCSGFILYTFAHFGVPVPHSTALLIAVGRPVARAEAQPGDIVVFTGTDAASTAPGHAGIVVSGRGERPLRFVHASSSRREPFVKVSQVENSDYERRFMQVRRVLGPGTGLVAPARPRPMPAPASPPPVAALPTRPVAVAEVALPVPALPQRLATKHYPAASATARKRPAGKKPPIGASAKKTPVKSPTAAKKKAALPVKRKVLAKPAPKPGPKSAHSASRKHPATKTRR